MKQIVQAVMERGKAGWIGSTTGLPDGKQALAAGKSWAQTVRMLRDAAERTLRVPSGSVSLDIRLDDPDLQRLVSEVRRTQAILRDAKFEAGAAMSHAARTLTKTVTVRDAAQMLGCSFQQVAKLAPKGREDNAGDTAEDWAQMLYLVAGLREPMEASDLAREAQKWASSDTSPFPDDPAFAHEVAVEHRALIRKAGGS